MALASHSHLIVGQRKGPRCATRGPDYGFFPSSGYIAAMLWRVRNSRGKPKTAPAAFIPPCRPTVSQRPPRGPGWVHELKHDGYRLQIHVRDGRVKLYTMNAADWTKRYPGIVGRQRGSRAVPLSTPRWCGSIPMASHNSTHCTAVSWITQLSPVPSIYSCLMVTISAEAAQ